MKLQKIVSHLQKLHPKEIDLSLDRIRILCEKLGNPQEKIKAISVVGTNGKQSTINAIFSILKEAKVKCNVYTSPHIQKINERFVFNNNMLSDDELIDLFEEVEKINDQNPLTFFEALSACYFYKAAQYPKNINLIEAGLFHRFDATNILKDNLASIAALIAAVVAIGGGFVKYGEITTKLNQIEANQGVDLSPIDKQIDEVKANVNGVSKNVKENKDSISKVDTKAEVNSKEIELLKLQIKEIQIKSNNPLGG